MDIVAKRMAPDADGVRIASLDEMSYRRLLWDHRPLTDFWRVGSGIMKHLRPYGIDTMGKIARLSLTNEKLLYDIFGVNAELLIDHAWGWEPVEIRHIKAYRPGSRSVSSGQVLTCPYDTDKARIVVREMADAMGLQLVAMKKVARQLTLDIGYDASSPIGASSATPVKHDRYGRMVPAPSHGTTGFIAPTSSSDDLATAAVQLFDRIVRQSMLVRRLTVTAVDITDESTASASGDSGAIQLDLFSETPVASDDSQHKRERRLQEALIRIKETYGKNSILKGLNFADGATQRQRNTQIGGHHE